MISITDIELSRREYLALPETEWRKDYFDESTGGYVVTSWERKQGAQIIIFEFEQWNNEFRVLVDELIRKGYHGRYYVTGEQTTHQF